MSSNLLIKDKIEQKDFIKIAPFKKEIRKTNPHKHNNYFELIYLSGGSGFHTIDSRKYQVQPPMVFVIRKEQVHHWDLEGEPEGFVLIIRKSFVDLSVDKALKNLLAEISASACISPAEPKVIEQLFTLMVKEYQPGDQNINPVMEGLMKAMLAKIVKSSRPIKTIHAKKPGLFDSYIELLSRDQFLRNSVAFYASQINTTPQNLNIACRKTSGQSATEILSEYIISETKRLLLYTTMTIGEIASSLRFKDNSHFTKYFRRHTGQTPHHFRASL